MLVEKVDLCPVKLKKMLGVLCLCHPSVELSPMKLVKNNRRILVVRKNWRKIGPFRHWTLKLILRLNYVYTSIYIYIFVYINIYIYIYMSQNDIILKSSWKYFGVLNVFGLLNRFFLEGCKPAAFQRQDGAACEVSFFHGKYCLRRILFGWGPILIEPMLYFFTPLRTLTPGTWFGSNNVSIWILSWNFFGFQGVSLPGV